MSKRVLYDYWRSSASYRVRIVMNLLGISCETVSVHLLKKEHKTPQHLAQPAGTSAGAGDRRAEADPVARYH